MEYEMKITNEYIASLNPCGDRHENYLKYYKDTEYSIREFIELDKISYTDKIWVLLEKNSLLNINQKIILAADFAERVLPIFEKKYPDDDRPRKALLAAKNMDSAGAADGYSAYTVYSAAAAAYSAAAAYAAAAAAAAYAAYSAYGAYGAAAAYSAAAASAAAAADGEEKYQLNLIADVMEGVVVLN
jgi:hypothetical protein